jgi:hypothetical protein
MRGCFQHAIRPCTNTTVSYSLPQSITGTVIVALLVFLTKHDELNSMAYGQCLHKEPQLG